VTRHIRSHPKVQAEPVDLDIRLMQLMTRLLMSLFGLMVVLALMWGLIRLPLFSITSMTLSGELDHNNVITIRANVTPQIKGNFFTVDLAQAQQIFQSIPWVRKAVVEREFPNRIRVALQEHKPAAFWGQEGEGRLLNEQGEVFDANWGEVEDDNLPKLTGPDNQSGLVLQVFESVRPEFKKMGLEVREFNLSERGSWSAKLANGGVVEIGRGEPQEIVSRVSNFTQTLPQVSGRYDRQVSALESADLRHDHGYALRLKGITTVDSQMMKR
jgi:cell division protein FtsQ